MRKMRIVMLLVLGLALSSAAFGQWRTELNSPGADEQMRLGVLAYHQGRYSEALLFFEKSLAYAPGEALTLYWLGLCYYRTGYEATALRTLEPLLELANAPAQLRAFVESLRARRALENAASPPRYVESAQIDGTKPKSASFSRPASILAQPDGSFIVVAQGSGQILRIDPNGLVKERISGGLPGLDRPFGIASMPDGSLYISEFNGDRILRIQGGQSKFIGSSGRGDGRLLGPQFLATDESGYLYVCDYGNSRISKFDSDGNFILSFGESSSQFPGFESPAGLAFVSDVLYVADSYAKTIYRFDPSGNYLGSLATGLLHFPEGISPWNHDLALLVADTDRVLSIDLQSERVDEIYRSPYGKPRIIGAVADNNGNILACDFDSSVISILSEGPSIAQGYQVMIDRVDASQFPKVRLSVTVRDRNGQAVVGLAASNFYLSELLRSRVNIVQQDKTETKLVESIAPASKVVFEGSGNKSPDLRVIVVLDRSRSLEAFSSVIRSSIVDLGSTLGDSGSMGLVLAGPNPVMAFKPQRNPDLLGMAKATQSTVAGPNRFDLGIRQAANTLMPGESRDCIVYFTNGAVDEANFQGTSISEIAALLSNNGIRFYAVIVGNGAVDPSIRFLAQKTGGGVLSASRPRGLGSLTETMKQSPSGRYYFSFTSGDDAAFGARQLFVSIEAYLYQKSGRDEIGYYAPLR